MINLLPFDLWELFGLQTDYREGWKFLCQLCVKFDIKDCKRFQRLTKGLENLARLHCKRHFPIMYRDSVELMNHALHWGVPLFDEHSEVRSMDNVKADRNAIFGLGPSEAVLT